MDNNNVNIAVEIIKALPTIVASVAATIASIVAIYGINSWRREFKGKRDIELAEEVLELFYRAQNAIRAIRSPLGHESEGGKVIERLKAEGKDSNISIQTAVLLERFEEREEIFQKLHALRYRFIARFGKDKAKPFDDMKQSINTMFISAKMLFILKESKKDGDVGTEDKPSVNEKIREYEANLTWGDDEREKIAPMVEAAVKQIEETCRKIIGSR
jgi:hypothetical protein